MRHRLPHLLALVLALLPTGALAQPVPPLEPPPDPPGNPTTESKVRLGQVLFWDEQISSTRTVSCGTCHIPASGGSDPRSLADPGALHPGADGIYGTPDDVLGSPGVPGNTADGLYSTTTSFGLQPQVTGRRPVSAIDAAYSPELFWDGRVGDQLLDPLTGDMILEAGAALENQALGPPTSPVEMAHAGRDWNDLATRVVESTPLGLVPSAPGEWVRWVDRRDYPSLFLEAFGSPEVTPARIVMAIAAYERTLFSDQTPFDLANAGVQPLEPIEQAGRGVFAASSCNACHRGALLSDDEYHYIGARPPAEDDGRFAVTGNPADLGAFRTPRLRGVELRAPFMHDGRFETLEEVVDFYDRGGDFAAPNKSNLIQPLGLTTEEKAALVAFLQRPLTDPRVASETAPFDRPTLYSESDRVPVVTGAGVAGSGGFEPLPIAVEPPVAGNPSFTLGLQLGLGGAEALLVVETFDPGSAPPPAGTFAWQPIVLAGSGPGNGWGSVSLEIPEDPDLVGEELFARWYVTDPGAPGGTAVSPVVRFTIFGDGVALEGPVFADGFESGSTAAWD